MRGIQACYKAARFYQIQSRARARLRKSPVNAAVQALVRLLLSVVEILGLSRDGADY